MQNGREATPPGRLHRCRLHVGGRSPNLAAMILILIAAGGAVGAVSRYLLGEWIGVLVMLRSGEIGKALVYVGSSVALALVAAWTGWQATLSLAGG